MGGGGGGGEETGVTGEHRWRRASEQQHWWQSRKADVLTVTPRVAPFDLQLLSQFDCTYNCLSWSFTEKHFACYRDGKHPTNDNDKLSTLIHSPCIFHYGSQREKREREKKKKKKKGKKKTVAELMRRNLPISLW